METHQKLPILHIPSDAEIAEVTDALAALRRSSLRNTEANHRYKRGEISISTYLDIANADLLAHRRAIQAMRQAGIGLEHCLTVAREWIGKKKSFFVVVRSDGREIRVLQQHGYRRLRLFEMSVPCLEGEVWKVNTSFFHTAGKRPDGTFAVSPTDALFWIPLLAMPDAATPAPQAPCTSA